jgi:hypothetical protein
MILITDFNDFFILQFFPRFVSTLLQTPAAHLRTLRITSVCRGTSDENRWAMVYGLDDQGVRVRVPVGSRIFSSLRRSDRLWSPPNLLCNRYRGLFPAVKRPECEVDHSPSSYAEVKKTWIYTSTPPYVFMS